VSATASELYERALRGEALFLRDEDGIRRPLPVERWLGEPGPADHRVLERARGPVLDIGCGPGRHVRALAHRGVAALGVDVAPTAVRHARDRGAATLLGSVFDPVPGAGHWRTALLLDGNIGIGGRPVRLMRRVGDLLHPSGSAICEVEPPGQATTCELVALEDAGGVRSGWFAWARVGVGGLSEVAASAGMMVRETWQDDGRWFALLERGRLRVRDVGVAR
jgi:SAM-dependent methyltransferase